MTDIPDPEAPETPRWAFDASTETVWSNAWEQGHLVGFIAGRGGSPRRRGQEHQVHSVIQQTIESLLKASQHLSNMAWDAAVKAESYTDEGIEEYLTKLNDLHDKAWAIRLLSDRLDNT